MIVRLHRRLEVRSLVAMLAVASFSPGCGQDEATNAPPNPSPRADLGQTVEPRVRRDDQGGVTKDISNAEKDLSKDLKPPVVKPGGEAAPTIPPTPKTDGAKTGTP
jgi:hypothetical protein